MSAWARGFSGVCTGAWAAKPAANALKTSFIWFILVGVAPDFTYGELGIVYSYTMELPGYQYGFTLPPQFIVEVGEESYAGAIVYAQKVRRRGAKAFFLVTSVFPSVCDDM